jgi:hypothetical protein
MVSAQPASNHDGRTDAPPLLQIKDLQVATPRTCASTAIKQ